LDISVDLWDVKTRSRLPLQELSSSSVTAIAVSADGRILAVGASGEIRVLKRHDRSWSPSSPLNYRTGAGANNVTWHVSALALNSDGTEMSSAFCFQLDEPDNRCVRSEIDIWQIGKAVPQRVLKLDGPQITALAFQPDGALLIANPAGLFSWDFEHRNRPMKFEALNGAIPLYIAMSRTGQPVACGTRNEDIVCWDVPSKNVISEFASAHSGPIYAIAACLDSHILASRATDGTLLLWNTDQHQRIGRGTKLKNTRFTGEIAITNDSKTFVVGSDTAVLLMDLKSGRQTPLGGVGGIGPGSRGFAVSPDGSRVAVPQRRTVAVWRLSDPPTSERILPIDGGLPWQVAFRSDGKVLASGSDNGKVHRWDLAHDFKSLAPFVTKSDSGHDEPVYTVAFSPDGRILAAGGTGALSIFDANSGQLLRSKKMPSTVGRLAFAPDGNSLAFGLLGGKLESSIEI